MKNIVFITLLVCAIYIFPQQVQTKKYCCIESFADSTEIQAVLTDYIINEKLSEGWILLIDYLNQNDSVSIISILKSEDAFELFYRKPVCYYLVNDNIIVYIRTDSVLNNVDTTFLNNLFFETFRVLYHSNKKVNDWYYEKYGKENILYESSYQICWGNDSIVSIKGTKTRAYLGLYDLVPVKYTLVNKKIVSKKDIEKTLLPDVGFPKRKDTGDLFRALPNWREKE